MADGEWDAFAARCERRGMLIEMGEMLNGEKVDEGFLSRAAEEGNIWLLRMTYCLGTPALKTYVCEHMGSLPPEHHDEAEEALRAALAHEHPVVREGAIYGLSALSRGEDAIAALAETDSSPGVRAAARGCGEPASGPRPRSNVTGQS